jgi:hypothetical protein
MAWFHRRLPRQDPCTCAPQWPGLKTEVNGYVLSAVPSDAYSVITNPDVSIPALAELGVGSVVARCIECEASYPHPWVIEPGEKPPFAWARED